MIGYVNYTAHDPGVVPKSPRTWIVEDPKQVYASILQVCPEGLATLEGS